VGDGIKQVLKLRLTSGFREVFRRKIWGNFAGISFLIAVICPERSESAAWRGAEAKPSTAEFQRAPKIFVAVVFLIDIELVVNEI